MRRALLLAGPAMILGAFLTSSALEAQIDFPHQTHSVFFSECTACHAGVPTGDWASTYPETSTCAACHDGTTAPSIDWAPPESPRASNLTFQHQDHGFACTTCHVPGGGEDLSLISIPEPTTCLGCHAPQAGGHMEAVEQCQTCHVPAAQSGLTARRMAEFPKPESHSFGGWVNGAWRHPRRITVPSAIPRGPAPAVTKARGLRPSTPSTSWPHTVRRPTAG
ncbi:MAG: cytochrome c3 family protein [Gemmatimonadota bacterium]|jgi:predicted CXXCH cytochrome family protein